MNKIYIAIDVEGDTKTCFMSTDLIKLKNHVINWVNTNCELDEAGPVVDFDKDYTGFEIGEAINID